MNKRIQITFLFLVLMQGLHSFEEYLGNLWEVLPVARLLSSLVFSHPETGFLIINTGLFVFGVLCFILSFWEKQQFFETFIWFWIIIEGFNGMAHPVWALIRKSYVPGLITAPLLLILAYYLLLLIIKEKHRTT